jgi:hypothetical protein
MKSLVLPPSSSRSSLLLGIGVGVGVGVAAVVAGGVYLAIAAETEKNKRHVTSRPIATEMRILVQVRGGIHQI